MKYDKPTKWQFWFHMLFASHRPMAKNIGNPLGFECGQCKLVEWRDSSHGE